MTEGTCPNNAVSRAFGKARPNANANTNECCRALPWRRSPLNHVLCVFACSDPLYVHASRVEWDLRSTLYVKRVCKSKFRNDRLFSRAIRCLLIIAVIVILSCCAEKGSAQYGIPVKIAETKYLDVTEFASPFALCFPIYALHRQAKHCSFGCFICENLQKRTEDRCAGTLNSLSEQKLTWYL